MNKLDHAYQYLLLDILNNGITKSDRTGTGTLSVFGRQIRHNMKDGFPLLTTKKMAFKAMATELLWFLRGDTNIKYLVDNGCNIWNGDAYKNWCKQFEVDINDFDGDEIVKGHSDQCLGYPILDNIEPTSKAYKRGQINAYLEGKADKPFFYLTHEDFINKIKTDKEFAKQWGELGPIYGAQWRSWSQNQYYNFGTGINFNEFNIDQIQNLINELQANPDSRRMMVSAWNVGDLNQMVLPPCHYGFQVYTRELSGEEKVDWMKKHTKLKDSIRVLTTRQPGDDFFDAYNVPRRAISLMWNQRSVDTFLGLPFNIASYGLLLTMLASEVNMVPDELIGNLGDVHLYKNHIEQAREQISRDSYELPTVEVQDGIFCSSLNDIKLSNYKSHPAIKAKLSN